MGKCEFFDFCFHEKHYHCTEISELYLSGAYCMFREKAYKELGCKDTDLSNPTKKKDEIKNDNKDLEEDFEDNFSQVEADRREMDEYFTQGG